MDGDGLQDIITGAWWYKNPGLAIGGWQRNDLPSPMRNMAAVLDIDGDGDMDVLGTEAES